MKEVWLDVNEQYLLELLRESGLSCTRVQLAIVKYLEYNAKFNLEAYKAALEREDNDYAEECKRDYEECKAQLKVFGVNLV